MILRLLGIFQIAGCLYLAYLRPEYRFVVFLFAFLALAGLIAAFRTQTMAEALRTQEEKLVKRVLRRIGQKFDDVVELAERKYASAQQIWLQAQAQKEALPASGLDAQIQARLTAQFDLFWPIWVSKLRVKAASLEPVVNIIVHPTDGQSSSEVAATLRPVIAAELEKSLARQTEGKVLDLPEMKLADAKPIELWGPFPSDAEIQAHRMWERFDANFGILKVVELVIRDGDLLDDTGDNPPLRLRKADGTDDAA